MCGIAGFLGIEGHKKVKLAWSLSRGIDNRGGHASGFVSLRDNDRIVWGRERGSWIKQDVPFYREAITGFGSVMHARYATCGDKDARAHAHPFCIKRNGAPVLWGVHNGIINNANESAKAHGRPYTVDSRELFELLADGEYDSIRQLRGYGTIVWVEASDRKYIRMARLTDNAELVFVNTTIGGMVYASTENILDNALKYAGLKNKDKNTWEPTHGKILKFGPDGVMIDIEKEIKMAEPNYAKTSSFDNDGYDFSHLSDEELDLLLEDSKIEDPEDQQEFKDWVQAQRKFSEKKNKKQRREYHDNACRWCDKCNHLFFLKTGTCTAPNADCVCDSPRHNAPCQHEACKGDDHCMFPRIARCGRCTKLFSECSCNKLTEKSEHKSEYQKDVKGS
jgi:predicted glutamine amidotransferase